MADDVDFSTLPFLEGRKLLEQLGVTLPRAVPPVAAPDPDLDPSVPATFGRLRALRELPRGRGRLILAHDEDLGRTVAVRLLDRATAGQSGRVDAFVAEARILARVGHPGAPAVYDFGHTDGGDLFFVTGSLDGRSLREALNDPSEIWTPGRAARIALRVAEVLGRAHDQRVVLGGLNPAGITLGTAGEVQITDWADARVTTTDGGEATARSRQKSFVRTAQLAQALPQARDEPPPPPATRAPSRPTARLRALSPTCFAWVPCCSSC
jgi:serine/threonine protein kinase